MAFNREENPTVTGRGDFEITFFVPGPGNTNDPQSGLIKFQLLMSDGTVRIVSADLLVRLGDDAQGATHLTNLVNLRTYIETRIDTEALPV